jgi:hypothetical protein
VFTPVAAKVYATVSGRGRQRVRGAAMRLPGLCVIGLFVEKGCCLPVWLQQLVEISIP